MKKSILTAAVAALTLSFAASAHANKAMSTEELVSYCASSNSESFVTCEIYGQGVYDTYLVYSQHRRAPKFVCVKQPAPSRKEVVQQYVEWAKAHPKYAKDPAADSILRFLGERFPCGKAAQ
jgi:hypothetical protein